MKHRVISTNTLGSLILIVLITASSLGMANAELGALDSVDVKKTETTTASTQQTIISSIPSHQSTKTEVDLSESMGISTNDHSNNKQPQNEISNPASKSSLVKTEINLSENFSIYDNIPTKNAFLVFKQSSDTVTTMQRISNLDKIRFNGRSIVVNDGLSNNNVIPAITFLENSELSLTKVLNHNMGNFEEMNEDLLRYISQSTFISSTQESIYKLSSGISIVGNVLLNATHDSVNGKNPTIFLLLVPLSGYILIRAEGGRLRFSNTKQTLSFCFMAILIASTVVGPISISPSFLAYAYSQANESSTNAQDEQVPSDNSTHLSFDYSNSTQSPVLPNSTQSPVLPNSTQSPVLPNSTQSPVLPNSTHLSFDYSNSTQSPVLPNSTHLSFDYSNSTQSPVLPNSTHLSFDYSNSTQSPVLPNSTQPLVLPNSTQSPVLPNSTQSWNFESQNNNTKTVGKISITNQTNNTVLQLQGNGFLTANGSATKELKDLTISAWVKPDYTQGSPIFTVISKENEFTLSINNEIPPFKTAQFSVFDGIKWHMVNSTVLIGQNWNNLAATFNGSSIALYVNGTLQSYMPITGVSTISVNGNLATKNSTDLSSNADIVIGAYYNNVRKVSESQFSGLLGKVNLYDSLLTPVQISGLYSQNLPSFYPSLITSISNSTTIQNTNSTTPMTFNHSNSTLVNNSTIPSNSTLFAIGNGTMGGLFLKHNKILVNQPVTWVQNVTLTNQTQDLAIELPADAQIVNLDVIHNKKLENLFNSSNNITSSFTIGQKQSINGIGISNNTDIQHKQLKKLEIINKFTRQKLQNSHNSRSLFVTVDNQSSPSVSLSQLPQVLQNNKPTKMLFVNESASKYDITYITPAPFTVEKDLSSISKYDKLVWVAHNSTLHYTNVTAFSNISEDLVKQGAHFKLYWMVNGSNIDVTNDPRFAVQLVDTNNNGIPDQMQWTVPKLSQQQFQITAQIAVINVQSYPAVGGNWTVYFNTTGTADLNITTINGTNFGSAPPADLKFLQLNNGTTVLAPTIQGNSVIYHNYSSSGTGFEISHVMTFGHHHLMFQFGNSTAYANNNAYVSQISVHTPLSVFIDSSGNFNTGSAIDYASKIGPGGGTPLFNVTSTAAFGVAVGNTGNVYAADTNNNLIDVYSSSGSFQSSFGSSTLLSPTGVTIDSSGNVYVADTGHDLVKEFSSSGTLLNTFGTGTGTSLGQFTGPMGVAVNSTGYVYVTDTGNNRTEIFNSAGTALSSFGTSGSSAGQFNSPIGITIDNFNNVYVADIQNDRIEKFSPSGTFIQTFGSFGTAGNQFDGPIGVGVDSNNGIYVADANNDRISKFNPDDVGVPESLTLSDGTVTKLITKSLSEPLSLSDGTVSNSITKLLSEPLSLSDGTVNSQVSQSITKSLSEPLSLSDGTVSNSITKLLSEPLSLSDGTVSNSITKLLSEPLSLSDGTVSNSITKLLSEPLSLSDGTVSNSITKLLSEPLSLSDGTVNSQESQIIPLSEPLSLSDGTVSNSITKLLSEPLSLSDGTVSNSITKLLSEPLSLSDGTVSNSITKSLSEPLSLSDGTVNSQESQIIPLSEPLSLSDGTVSNSITKLLSEPLSLSDGTVSNSITKLLSEPLSLSDGTVSNSITKSLSEPLSLSDGTVNSQESQIIPLSEPLSLSDGTVSKSHTISLTDSLGLSDSTISSQSLVKSLSELLSVSDQLTKQNSLSLQESFGFTDSSTATANLGSNQVLVENAQKSITVNQATSQLVIKSSNAALTTITIPSSVTTPSINYSSISTTSGNAVTVQASTPLTITKYTNGNSNPVTQIKIPANTAITGTSWNGVLTLPTIQTDSSVTIPTQAGQTNTVNTVIEVGAGTTPLTFNNAVQMIFPGQANTRVGFYYSPSTITEITSTCTDNTQTTNNNLPAGGDCKINEGSDLVVWTKHFTGFATWSSSSSSTGSTGTSTGFSSGGGGGGSVNIGSGFSLSGLGESVVGQGGILSDLKILDVSYDTCNTNNTVKILIAYSDNSPSVVLRTSLTGIIPATAAKEQPFAAENENATIQKLVYEASIDPKETTFEVQALQAIGNDVNSVGKTIDITRCQGETSFEQEQVVTPVEIDTNAPRIFDVKFQLDNGTKISSSEDNHTVNSQSMTVSAIMDSKTIPDDVELRFVKAGDPVTSYGTIKMDVTSIPISNSTYLVSGTIPQDAIISPALTYWISAHNAAGKTTDSDSYSIGVEPNYPVVGNIELDIKTSRIGGTVAHPTAYYSNNSTGPVYGRIVLLINGTVTYVSPSQVFATGQNIVNLEWNTPSVNNVSPYQLQARAEVFGKSIDTTSAYVDAFPGTMNLPISKLANVVDISVGNNTIAKASALYSSFNNDGTMRFKVTTSDGTCVIGADANCLVTNSTLGLAGNFKTVTIGDQVYRVRYSGSNDVLERFSITSVDSVSGNWKVEIDSTNGLLPNAHAMDDVFLKVKYRAINLPFVSD